MSTMDELSNYLTVDEFAEPRRIHRATAYRLIDRGSLAATRMGNRLMISAENAADFDRRRETGRPLWPRRSAGAMTEQFRVLLGALARRDGKATKAANAELDRLGVTVSVPDGVAHLEQVSPAIAKQARGELLGILSEWTVAGSQGMAGEMIRLEKELSKKGLSIEVLV